MKCPYCKEEIADEAIKCKHCGSMLNQKAASQIDSAPVDSNELPFYKDKFDKFNAKGGFLVTWNWPAMLFGPFWYFYRSMVVKGFLYLVLGCVACAIITPFPVWIYFGIMGNYDYYLLKVKNKQLW